MTNTISRLGRLKTYEVDIHSSFLSEEIIQAFGKSGAKISGLELRWLNKVRSNPPNFAANSH